MQRYLILEVSAFDIFVLRLYNEHYILLNYRKVVDGCFKYHQIVASSVYISICSYFIVKIVVTRIHTASYVFSLVWLVGL